MRENILRGIAISFLFILSTGVISAVSMESPRFQIDNANVNSASGDKSSSGYKLSDTIGQTAAGRFSSSGFIVRAGFQYIHSIIPFQFSISDINVNLGTLAPGMPSTATTVLTVSFGSAGQYQVTAIEEGPLKTFNGVSTIDDTTCDGGAETCDESTAKTWSSNSAYGFGYNMSGDDIPGDFTSASHYRPFPDRTEPTPEPAAVVMSSVNVGRDRQATLTFKVNISPVQPFGSYQTVVNFVATPGF